MSRVPLASAEAKFRRSGHGSQAMPNNSKWYSTTIYFNKIAYLSSLHALSADFRPDPADLDVFGAKNRPDMEVRTNFGNFQVWGGQVKSGQIGRAASVRTKGAFPGSGLPYHYPGSYNSQYYLKKSSASSAVIWNYSVEHSSIPHGKVLSKRQYLRNSSHSIFPSS